MDIRLDVFPAVATIGDETYGQVRVIVADGIVRAFTVAEDGRNRLAAEGRIPGGEWAGLAGWPYRIPTETGEWHVARGRGCGCGHQLRRTSREALWVAQP